MKEYKYKFISNKVLFGIFLAQTIFFFVVTLGNTISALWGGFHILLVGDILYLAFFALSFTFLCKEVYVVKVYEDKITFKAFLQKEKVLHITQIKNIYEWPFIFFANTATIIYSFDTRDDATQRTRIDDDELLKTGVMKFGYPFKIVANDQTTKIIREFWNRPILKVQPPVKKDR